MPIFEYRCKADHTTEKLVMPCTGHSSNDEIVCPVCKRPAYLIFSKTSAPILKEGSGGFYRPTKEPPSGNSGGGLGA